MALVENENRLRQAVRQIGRCLGQSEVKPSVTAPGIVSAAEAAGAGERGASAS
jgi:hypothetical protein